MEATAIDNLLASLAPSPYGWRVPVPAAEGTFFGHPVRLDIQTQSVPESDPPPQPDASETALARSILGDLSRVLVVAEQQLRSHVAGWDPSPIPLIHEPHLWVDREALEEDGPARWALVVGQVGAPSYGLHLEFDGLEFVECWSGD